MQQQGESSASAVKQKQVGGRRACHLASILPLTEYDDETDSRSPIDFRVCLEASAYMALQHLNNPSEALVDLSRLQSCDIDFSVELRDSQFSPIHAARQLYQTLPTKPFAVLGAARSAVSNTLATLAGSYQLPQISPSSTSGALDDKQRAPFFARTVPTNKGDAEAYCLYLSNLGITHFGIYFIRDDFGLSYHADLTSCANEHNLKPISVSYDEVDIPQTMQFLASTQVRYIVGIFNPNTWQSVMRQAQQFNICGPGYTWLLSEASLEFTSPSFALKRETQSTIAHALNGAGILTVDIPPSPILANALDDFFANNTRFERYIDTHVNKTAFAKYTGPTCGGSSVYPLLAYDAVLALGIAACDTREPYFTGPQLFSQLLETSFEGISGKVSFSNLTGTRSTKDLRYRLENIVISETRSDETQLRFDTFKAVQVDLSTRKIFVEKYFIYADNTTNLPFEYPPLQQDMNLIPPTARGLGLALGGFVMLLSLLFLVWTWIHRKDGVVRASQPIFLAQICIGTFIMTSAVIPFSLQEPVSQNGLDIACMLSPWCISIGFVTAFSALFTKTWRLNKLFASGYRRVQVRARDVVLPFLVLMAINILVLMIWTIVSPIEWARIEKNSFDNFGRVVESYGSCVVGNRGDDSKVYVDYIFISVLLVVNFVAVVSALLECYHARNLPSEFSESFYITVSVALIFETSLVAVPILLLTLDSPAASFITRSVLLSFVSLTILLPMFVPKYVQLRIRSSMDPTGIHHSRQQRSSIQAAVSHNRWGFGGPASTSRSQNRRSFSNQSHHFSSSELLNRRSARGARQLGESRIRRTDQYFEQQTAIQMNRDASKHNSSVPRSQNSQLSMKDEHGKEKVEQTEPRGTDASKTINSMSTQGENHKLSGPGSGVYSSGGPPSV